MPTPVRRILIIEDQPDSADQLARLLSKLGTDLGIAVDVEQVVYRVLPEFIGGFDARYDAAGLPHTPNDTFDIFSLDLIFQAIPDMTGATGGEQLFHWLDQRGILPHLGDLVIRSHTTSEILTRHAKMLVHKQTSHEAAQWRELLRWPVPAVGP